jgi:sugar/nucleoside kinase (ribokinase family)
MYGREVKPMVPCLGQTNMTLSSFKTGPTISFDKANMTYSFGGITISMQVAVALADLVVSTLTDENGMFVERNMKSEYIDIYHNHLEGADN